MKKVIAILSVVAFVATAAFATDAAKATASPAAGTAASAAPAATNMSVAGTIVSFTADKTKKTLGTLVVVDSAKAKTSYVLTSTTTIFNAAKKAGTVKDLAKNKKATVEYTVAGKVNTAVSVTL